MPSKPWIIAEISANHLGSFDRALKLIDVAEKAGADAVKFQLYDPDKMAPEGYFLQDGPWKGRGARDLYREAMTPAEWFEDLFHYARARGIEPFSSVFDLEGLELLERLGCERYKIASFELVDERLIRAVAKTGKQVILSTGMATFEEIANAVCWVRLSQGSQAQPMVLKCTSGYPAPIAEANLAAMADLREKLGCPIGLSDHTPGYAVAVAATALGAEVIEKHLTLARADGGPDAAFSMEPLEFDLMVTNCRMAAQAIGEVRYGPTPSEAPQVPIRGRTLRAA